MAAHNALAAAWLDPTHMAEAIHNIKQANNDIGALNLDIANLLWLNSTKARDKSGCGPLMLSFKN